MTSQEVGKGGDNEQKAPGLCAPVCGRKRRKGGPEGEKEFRQSGKKKKCMQKM